MVVQADTSEKCGCGETPGDPGSYVRTLINFIPRLNKTSKNMKRLPGKLVLQVC